MGKKRKTESPLQPSPKSVTPAVGTSGRTDRFDVQCRELRQQLTALQRRVDELEIRNDCLEQRSRLPCLIFSGPAIPKSGLPDAMLQLIGGIIKDKVGYELNLNQVQSSFRLRNGGLFVEFASAGPASDRDTIFRSKSQLRGTGLYVSESLTRRRQGIFKVLLQMKKAKEIHSLYTQSGNIFIRRSLNSPPLKVSDLTDLQRLSETESVETSQRRAPITQFQSAGIREDAIATPGLAARRAGPRAAPAPESSTPADSSLAPPVRGEVPPPADYDSAAPLRRDLAPCQAPAHPEPTASPRRDLAPCRASAGDDPAAVTCRDLTPRQALADRTSVTPAAGGEAGADATGPADGLSPASTRYDATTTTEDLTSSMEKRLACWKMRVLVSGRSRVITISNKDDVIQTVNDLVTAAKQEPLEYYKDITTFQLQYNLRVLRLVQNAETEGENVKRLADAARQVQKEVQQLLRELRPTLDSEWARARR